jgi:glutamate-1-semialdehyde 2,1-aminomutase
MLEAGLLDAARQAGVPLTINRIGSIMSCFSTDRPVRNFDDVQATNVKSFKRFFTEMLKRGIYLAPSAYEAMFISLAHSKTDIDRTITAAGESLRCLRSRVR